MSTKELSGTQFVVCIRNTGYEVSLEPRKIYRAGDDQVDLAQGFIRVVDESGEDYLYPSDYFLPLQLSPAVAEALLRAS